MPPPARRTAGHGLLLPPAVVTEIRSGLAEAADDVVAAIIEEVPSYTDAFSGPMGETIRTGRIHDSWHIRRNGRLVWVDALHLEGDIAAQMAAPFAFGDANSTATILYVGPDAADHLTAVRTLIDGAQGGATTFDGLLIVRLLSVDAAALRRSVIRIVAGLRHLAGGYLAAMPNVWHC